MASSKRIKIGTDGTISVPSEWIVAKITAVGSVQVGSGACLGYPHSWQEQKICQNGYDYEDNIIAGNRGTTSSQPAFALDGSAASVNDLVLLRPRAINQAGKTVYEFFKGGGGNTMACPHVSSVQCTGGYLSVTYDTACVAP